METLTVTQFNKLTHDLLKTCLPNVLVEGEISNFICSNSKHWYFSLKDDSSQVRCVMFHTKQHTLKFKPENGMHVLVRASASLYENRGDFQLIVESLEEIGFGKLQRAFEELKLKLKKEGLFDEKYKKPIPKFPKTIGVITSKVGAAIHDVLSVLNRRFPIANIILYPTQIQGDVAAKQIVQNIKIANSRNECDVLILCRGGGSIEDLWPFNEEIVAYAIFESQIPIITGIGHEIDFTIADFVADIRAPTPSVAAEIVAPDKLKLLSKLKEFKQQLKQTLYTKINQQKSHLDLLQSKLKQNNPKNKLEQQAQKLDRLIQTLFNLQNQILENKKIRLSNLSRTLNAVSPLSILKRGFAMIYDANNNIIRDSKNVKIGDKIKTELSKGVLYCKIEEIIY